MATKYNEYKQLSLTQIGDEIRQYWSENDIFSKSLKLSEGNTPFVFFEGPPSANGKPGIHHVMARSIKDIFCRYKTQKGFYVKRKAGWDTHGLPVELGVETKLGITKEDIGKKISVDDYNRACREEVMKYKDLWDELTRKMGYWVDLNEPYITFTNEYIETLWFLLSELYKKGLLYKGYTIQPFSPAAGTGLSSHELNMPGCYRDVKDTTCIAMFRLKAGQNLPFGTEMQSENVYLLAWTTTPWTLPSNTALCVGPNIDYILVKTYNPYSGQIVHVVIAKPLLNSIFPAENADIPFEEYQQGDKKIPFQVIGNEVKGKDLKNLAYEQLIPWVNPGENAFRVILGDYVTTEDGTGIVHIAPTFGADDDRVAKQAGIPPLVMTDKDGKQQPMVDRSGKFFLIKDLNPDFVKSNINIDLYKSFEGKYVKNAYDLQKTEKDPTLDVDIVVMLKTENKLFKSEKHTHSYPHCWRTDKPVLYYPLDSWFIKTTALKDRMIELNKTINWKPEATGSGRFGNWLENLVDWNLSRSRYWGTPLPIWRTEDGSEEKCIGSVEQLRNEIDKAVEVGFMKENPYKSNNYNDFDLHRPYIDQVVLVSEKGQKMMREPDLIDVWFDSGAMPYAQCHYMGKENQLNATNFPADFIAEGVDQTRGWFFTLHAIATMIFDKVAYKNVISNGLVLDKNGNKMSKRLGNAVDPFETIEKYGPDATRWYMITNSQPWDNLKFDVEGIDEVSRKFFGTLYNTYSFFALYANIDNFTYAEKEIDTAKRPEIDRWILSELNTLIKNVDTYYNDYEPTKAGRAIQEFVDSYLSNWYVRLCRRRFWKGEYSEDKISAYQTLYTCLETLSQLMAPIAPFFAERMFCDLNNVTRKINVESVHHTKFPEANETLIDKELEERMQLAQKISSMVLSLRKRNKLRVRQPLAKIMIPAANDHFIAQINAVKELILSEVNVKQIDFLTEENNILVKTVKPNFKTLGPKYGKIMKSIAIKVATLSQEEIGQIEQEGQIVLTVENQEVELQLADVEIFTQDIPGWIVANEGNLTVALDIVLNEELIIEGLAREVINRIQNYRKDSQLDVVDKICVQITKHPQMEQVLALFGQHIASETLAEQIVLVEKIDAEDKISAELVKDLTVEMLIEKA
ncbi:MAG: isoleucine--tRNA ligase [Bacteroidales bacterium]|nr:isoleucine--tRNA ligase [Bacteroidales bacterium]